MAAKRPKTITLKDPDDSIDPRENGGSLCSSLSEIYGRPEFYFDDGHAKRRRQVTVSLSTFRGSIGAIHFYLKVEEETEYVWDPIEGEWRRYDLYNSQKTKKFEHRTTSLVSIQAWVDRVLPIEFPAKTHEVDLRGFNESMKGYLGRRELVQRDGD